MAMMVSFRRQASVTPESLAREVGRSLGTSYSWDMLEAVKNQFGFRDIELPSNASLYPVPEQWQNWLSSYGPLWVTTIGAPSHAIIINGISGDLTPEGTTMSVLNPWDTTKNFDSDPVDFNPSNYGSKYTQPFQDFAAAFGSLGLDNYGRWRVLYLPAIQTRGQSLAHQLSAGNGNASLRVRSLNGGQSFDINWNDVELVPQLNAFSCWAAAAAMVVGWRDKISIDPSQIAAGTGQWAAYARGLRPENHRDLADAWRLEMDPPQCYSVEAFRHLIETKGPLWVGVAVPSGHAVTVIGMYGDGTPDGTFVRFHDPWPPGAGSERQVESYGRFMQEYENRITGDPAGNVNVQILHAGDTSGRVPLSASESYASSRELSLSRWSAAHHAKALSGEPLTPGDIVKVGGKTYVIYASEIRSGGVPAWINNNPGNISKSSEAERYGAFAGKANGDFAVFPDQETGFNAIISFLEARKEKNILQMMSVYAPVDDGKNPMLKGNNPEAYARMIAPRLGVPVTTKVSDLSDEQLQKFAEEIKRIETGPSGAGTIYAYDDPALPNAIRERLPTQKTVSEEDVGVVAQAMAERDSKVQLGRLSAAAGTADESPVLGLKEIDYTDEIDDASALQEEVAEPVEKSHSHEPRNLSNHPGSGRGRFRPRSLLSCFERSRVYDAGSTGLSKTALWPLLRAGLVPAGIWASW
jgi:hypothetical protein